MKNITYQEIHKSSSVHFENELYVHWHNPEFPDSYDSNCLEFKQQPSLTAFMEAETYLRKFHLKNGQQHVKFYFPQDGKPSQELLDYLGSQGYSIGMTELYVLKPGQFIGRKAVEDIRITSVDDTNADPFLKMQYSQDRLYGETFAKQKQDLLKQQIQDPDRLMVMAYDEGTPAGFAEVIIKEQTAEIDNLLVLEESRGKGIGTAIQQYVVNIFPDKMIILVADGDDTPRQMYKKQGYQYRGFRYEVQKI